MIRHPRSFCSERTLAVRWRESWGALAACVVVLTLMAWRADLWSWHNDSVAAADGVVEVFVYNRQGELVGRSSRHAWSSATASGASD